jgi:aspartyl/asparaginyl-tRNA synthetase
MEHKSLCINPYDFHAVSKKLRAFFEGKGFIEVHTQNRLSILAACEDPSTISTVQYAGKKWPLPQTGQMWLEFEMLKDPSPPGYFCMSTSYRNEPNPIEGRHDLIFPMFEFELKGGMDELRKMEMELLDYLGYNKNREDSDYPCRDYEEMAKKYDTRDLEHKHEQKMYSEYGSAFFLENFPDYTSPFWNMKRNKDGSQANKIDVILSGQETIGSAERSSDPVAMKEGFKTISDGMYAKTIYNHFGTERVDKELEEFLAHTFIPRSGGGIGMTRLIRSMKMENLI